MKLHFSSEDCFEYLVAESIGLDSFRAAAKSGKQLKVKLGIDPTSTDIHLGRSVVLWRLRAFQEMGHQIHLIVGDFTGQIGDTSDKDSERPMLDSETISKNMARYEEQLWLVLNPEKRDLVHIHYNSMWLAGLTLGELSRLADAFSVNQFIKRELIARRLEEGSRISLREMLYPLMQGYDSLMVESDIELGGTDQRFNLLAGRTLQEQAGKPGQGIIMNPLIRGLDGRKMSSSWGNVITLLEPAGEKFGKTMTLRDDLMTEFLSVFPRSARPFSAEELLQRLEQGENPRDLKMQIAQAVVALYHGDEVAAEVREAYIAQFQEGQLPDNITQVSRASIDDGQPLTVRRALVVTELTTSLSEASRLVEQGGVRLNGEVVTDANALLPTEEVLLQVGKRRFVSIIP